MSVKSSLVFVGLLFVVLSGCGPGSATGSASGPIGTPEASTIMAPFDGKWTLDWDKTLAAIRAGGATEEQIESLRRNYANDPSLSTLHPNLTITGNVAMGDGRPSSEYRFFRMHKHGTKTCGMAWHHEDRFDPGDMSKCHVRLEVVGSELRLEVYMHEALPDLNDPDILTPPPVENRPEDCEVEAKTTNEPGAWQTYVFRRG